MRKRVLLTGANGFVGAAILSFLQEIKKRDVLAVVRAGNSSSILAPDTFKIPDLGSDTDWSGAFDEVGVVIHAAARAHVMNETESDTLGAYRRVNVEGTRRLAEQAAKAGVPRFIFVSSIGVNGNQSIHPFTEQDAPAPQDAYAVSKYEAEKVLLEVSGRTGMEVVVIRPPLVVGPGAPGNFGKLVRWVQKGVPLPLGAVCNKRTLVSVDNLVDLIVTCVDHPAAANQVFLAGDDEDLSTTELLRRVGKAMGRPARLVPVPTRLLKLGAAMLGKGDMARRLLGSLQVDISKARDMLGWKPPISVDEGLRRVVESHVRSRDG